MIFLVPQLTDHVVNRTLDALGSFVTGKFHELYGVESEIKNLSRQLRAIQAVLEDAERFQQGSYSREQQVWLTDLQDLALDVEDVVAIYATEAPSRSNQKFTAPLAWLRFRSEAASKIKQVAKSIDTVSKEKNKFHSGGGLNVNLNPSPPTARVGLREEKHIRDTSEIIGREQEKEEIVNWLLSNEHNLQGDVPVIAIIGMGGLGKTTLAQLVCNDERIHKKQDKNCHFKVLTWVNVSADFNVDRILKEMLEIVTGRKQDMMAANEDRILQRLAGKRFLLVLDDAWLDKLEWESLHRVLKLCHRQSKVLITSRNEDVAKKMGALHMLRLDVMPEDECWTLFSKRVFGAVKCPEELEQIGKEIIRRCKFLPLAVKAMAGLLCRDPSEQRMKNILKDGIWKSDQSRFGNDTSNILPALKLSYDDLPPQLKQCFAYCCLFPKGNMFEKNELVKLWIVEGYIQPFGAEKIEETGSYYFNELLSRSFFRLLDVNVDKNELIKLWIAEGRITDLDHADDVSIHFKELLNSRQLATYTERYKMHDLIHDMARDVSSGCQQVEENDSSSVKQQSRHLSFLGQDAKKLTEGVLKAQKLRTLLLPTVHPKDFGQTLDKMFRTLSYLRVLDLSTSTIKDLPESIGELKLLGYLDLSRTEIRMLPNTICNLHNLQILKLLWCLWLWKLPKDFGNLKKLMYLELDDMFWYKCSALPPKIGGLTNLHYLYAFHVRGKSGYGIDELGCMNSLEGTLRISNLENTEDAKRAKLKQKESISGLVLEWSDKDADPQEKTAQERVLEDLEPHHGLQELHINHFKGNQFSGWMRTLRCLKEVSINQCINCRALSLGPLPHLGVLRIKGMLELVQWPEMINGSLTRLSISNCPKLKELPGNFPNLISAKIKQCDALTALSPVMPSLTFMVLMNNALLEGWCEDVSTTGQSFRIYLELRVINCPKLQELPQIFYPQKLEVSGCTSLRTIPGPQCSQLECLELDKCIGTSLIEAIPSTSSLYSLSISNVKNLAYLPQFPHLPGLQALYIDNCDDLTSLSSESDCSLQTLTSLKLLSISGCRTMKTFQDGLPTSIEWLNIKDCSMLKSFHSRNFLTNLTSLKDLYLEDCPQLEFLPEDGLPTGLQHLCIQGCPLLTQKCSQNTGGQYWPMIRHIDDLEIDFIKTPESRTATCPEIRCLGCFRA